MNKEEFLSKYGVDRRNTSAVKWDGMQEEFGRSDLYPLWVADTEFKIPESSIKALQQRVAHGAFGYSITPEGYYDAYFNWQKERYGIELHKDWLRFGTGVVQSLSTLLQFLTEPGDSVMIQEPVYHPFRHVVENNGRQVVANQLVDFGSEYKMDLEKMEEQMVANDVKVLMLCNPHNPVARVWTEQELTDLLELCRKEQVIVISDEIHHDLLPSDKKFVSALSIKDGFYRDNMIMVDSPSKTFNMAGLLISHVVIPNPQLRDRYDQQQEILHGPASNILGLVAGEAAYRDGADWLDGLLAIVRDNYNYLKEHLQAAFPEIKLTDQEGTYLAWVDLSGVVAPEDLKHVVQDQAKLAVDFGSMFGKSGAGHIRINLATTPENLQAAVSSLVKTLQENQA
ncbi:MalY/PatB family protein [Ligilactobacillus pobuzihii]|uniref:cysteine-S-conjugate beta-lyase n=1 Tax=Ligilactobacillus pobuzihii TaxID=449659 RepID=A0A0R2LCD7_9LACO|nr:MalY/PatB family protein [Ligilactobacillus pobuzihii]KRK11016.1 aminotransferase [Ligilactobacillus pobuzihii E100301 = KCTC 13174]KRN99561.1 aminotransferase [Ligilactobacillus pobuzihii]GEN48342.1 aminotransferase [Ligilactobacillus pobuzihii]